LIDPDSGSKVLLAMPIKPVDFVWMDGKFVKWNEAHVHVMAHCLQYGTGVFEGIRAYPTHGNLSVFRLKDHYQRLLNSAKIYMMDAGYSLDQLCDATIELLRKNNLHETSYVRPIVFRGFGDFGLNPLNSPVQAAICTFPTGDYLSKTGIKACVSTWRRIPDMSLPTAAKACGSYINSSLAKLEAVLNGFDEAILLDYHGNLGEGSGENVFLVKNGKLLTPHVSASILEGITRASVIQIARDQGYTVTEPHIAKSQLYTCDELFFTGTAAEITPILEVDRRKIGDGKIGPVTSKLREAFTEIVSGDSTKYKSWLTEVY
jgi:branched-chain amino acid aminotransferase